MSIEKHTEAEMIGALKQKGAGVRKKSQPIATGTTIPLSAPPTLIVVLAG